MSDKQRIDSFIDVQALRIEKEQAEKLLDELQKKINASSSAEIKLLSAGSTKESVKGLKDIQQATNDLTTSQNHLNKVLAAAADVKAKYNGSTETVIKTAQKLADTTAKEAKAAEASAKAAAASSKASIAAAKAKELEARYVQRLQKEQDKLAKQREKEQKVLDQLTDDYYQLSKAYEDQAKKAKNYALQLGQNHPLAVEAAADAQRLQKTLSDLDASTGRYTRNVGNYQSATMALTQVLREAPAFANSFATGVSAIGNNLPILTDEYKKLKDSGLSTAGAFKVLAGALFSFSGLLPIAFLLIQTYGKEIAEFGKSLFSTKKGMDSLVESQKILNQAFKGTEFSNAVQMVDELRINIDLAKQGLLDKNKVLKQYNESIGETTGKVSTLDEAEKALIKNTDAYVQMMYYKAAATLALQKAAEKAMETELIRRKADKEFFNIFETAPALTTSSSAAAVAEQNEKERKKQAEKRRQAAIKELKDETNAFKDIAKDFQKNVANIAKDFKFDPFAGDSGSDSSKSVTRDLKAQFEIVKRGLEEQIKLFQELADAEGMSGKSRTDARQKAYELTAELIEKEKQFELSQLQEKLQEQLKEEGLTAAQILTIRQNAADEVENINDRANTQQRTAQEQLATDLLNIWQSYKAKQKQQMADDLALFKDDSKAREAAEIDAAGNRLKARENELKRGRDIELKALEERKAAGKITEEQYQAERLRIETDYNNYILLAEIDFTKKMLELKKAQGADVTAELKRIAELELAIVKAKNEKIEANDKNAQEKYLNKLQRIKQYALEVSDTLGTLLTGNIDREKNAIQEQMDNLDKKTAKEIEAAQQSTATEEEKAAKVQLINARAQSQKEALERRQRQLDVQRAQYERAANIARIIADTAAAIMSQLKVTPLPAGAPLVAGIGVTGAAQLARVLATPIPKYAEGTDDHPGGLAIVGDGGRKEVVITPSGSTHITSDKPTIVDLPKHSIVLPDVESFKKSAFANLSVTPVPQFIDRTDELIRIQKETTERLINVVRDKREIHLQGSHAGVMAMHKYSQRWVQYVNENTQF